MDSSILNLTLNIGLAVLGIGVGWWLRSMGSSTRVTVQPGAEEENAESKRAREVMARLHELAARVAADVGEHSHRMEAINEELASADVSETEVVVKAVTKLVQANNQMQDRLTSAEGKLQEQKRLIESHAAEARTDALTGLANRRAFDAELSRCEAEFRANGRPFAVAMADVDHFKKFNDTYGHQAGDEVLRGVAQTLRRMSRETDLVARYGGEEFVIVLQNATAAEAAGYVERSRQAIQNAVFQHNGQDLHVTISLGVAHLMPKEDAVAVVERADSALYSSKAAGRNCVHWHDGEKAHRHHLLPEAPKPEASKPEASKPEPREPVGKPGPKAPPAETPAAAEAIREIGGNPLGRLLNRTAFCASVNNRLAEFRRGGQTPSVVLIRLDGVDGLMKQHGKNMVDTILKASAKFLLAAVREMDSVASYDGTAFGMLFPATGTIEAAIAADRLRKTIEKSQLTIAGKRVTFTVSIGTAEAKDSDDLARLLSRSEQALGAAVQSGGNTCYCHNGQWSEPAPTLLARMQPKTAT